MQYLASGLPDPLVDPHCGSRAKRMVSITILAMTSGPTLELNVEDPSAGFATESKTVFDGFVCGRLSCIRRCVRGDHETNGMYSLERR